MEKFNIGLLGIIGILLLVVSVSGCTSSGNSTASGNDTGANSITVGNLSVKSAGYGGYTVKATITPNKDVSYLEMVAISYDSTGAIIERTPLVWNINDAKKGQVYKVTGSVYVQSTTDKPVKMDILIFDSAFAGGSEDGNIFKQTVKVS